MLNKVEVINLNREVESLKNAVKHLIFETYDTEANFLGSPDSKELGNKAPSFYGRDFLIWYDKAINTLVYFFLSSPNQRRNLISVEVIAHLKNK